MKLTIFQSDKGDCLLLTSEDGQRRILVDGGMSPAYREFVAPKLGALAADNQELDLIYVSHIDQDHISGVVQLLDDAMDWRVHEFQISHGNPTHRAPKSPRPPHAKDIWHNAFHELLPDNSGEIGDLLAASASILSGASESSLREISSAQRDLAASIPEAIRVSRRIGEDQLGIPLNRHFDGKLAYLKTDQVAPVGSIRLDPLDIFVIGPFEEDLVKLRADWNTWLQDNNAALLKLQNKARRDAERLGTSDALTLLNLRLAQAETLGNRSNVTPPNLASLMLLVKENGKTLLLTGDGHGADILKGLGFHQMLDAQGRMHVDVLKVQHHGSENNIDEEFVSKISADHYIFCGNGEHENPNLRVVEIIIDARLGDVPFSASHPSAAGPFKLWFNSSESASKRPPSKEHMRKICELVEARAADSAGRMSFEFLEGSTPSLELTI